MPTKTDYSKYILPAGIVVGGYLILSKLGIFGPTAGDSNSTSMSTATAQGVQDSLAQAAAAGDIQTISDANAATLANTIFNSGVASPVDQDAIQNAIIQANTQTDLLKIIQAFGSKKAGGVACSVFGNLLSSTCSTYDVAGFLRAVLDYGHINDINNYFSSEGLNFTI